MGAVKFSNPQSTVPGMFNFIGDIVLLKQYLKLRASPQLKSRDGFGVVADMLSFADL
jgi:hypothetical protein